MNTKHSPRKVTLAMIKGKPITTSVPVIHYHASDDELQEIYPSTDEERRLTPEFEKISSKVTDMPLKCADRKSANESDNSENNSESRSISIENALPEGTPPSLDPWKVFSDIKGKITKTLEEKLSEMKSDKRKRSHSQAETSSISDSEGHESIAPSDDKSGDKQLQESGTSVVCPRSNPARYVDFAGVKTGLKDDRNLEEECIESGIEASEFTSNVYETIVSSSKTNSSSVLDSSTSNNDSARHKQQSCTRPIVLPKQIDFKAIFLHLVKQLISQITCRSFAVLVVIPCIYYVTPLPEYLLGFVVGILLTITFYDALTKVQTILTTFPDENFVSRLTIPVLEIPAVEEHAVIERFQGWLNELPYTYEPSNYHVARTKSVFFRLEGNILRIMETRMKIPKKAVWDEPKHRLKFSKRRVYNLIGAKIELLPRGLARRRRWSKKYPICITLRKRAFICNVTLKSSVSDERSDNYYHCKETESKIQLNLAEKERTTKWTKAERYEHEAWFVDADGVKPMTRQYEEEKEQNGAEVTAEDDDDDENYYHDLCNDDIDNEYADNFAADTEACRFTLAVGRKKRKRKKKRLHEDGKGVVKEGEQREMEWVVEDKNDANNGSDDDVNKQKLMEDDEEGSAEVEVEDEEEEEEEEMVEGDGEEEVEEMEEDEEYEMEEEVSEENYNDDINNDNGDSYDDEDKVGDDDGGDVNDGGEDEEDKDRGHQRIRRAEDTTTGGMSRLKSFRNTYIKSVKRGERKGASKIFIFARADREKEDWYRRLVSASSPSPSPIRSRCGKKRGSVSCKINTSNPTMVAQQTVASVAESKTSISANNSFESVPELHYNAYMTKYLSSSCSTVSEGTPSLHTDNTLWINCLIARILFDVHKCPETINLIQDKIQRKLSNIKLPYFMECLLVSEVAIGQGAPVIRSVTKPVMNERGLWLDFDMTYKGSLTMTVETKLNLMKLTKTGGSVPRDAGNVIVSAEKHESLVRSPIFDSDLEDTPETSTEDEDASRTQLHNTAKDTSSVQSSGKKFLSMVDRIAANKYFQHATELSYVRRAMEGVSNTEIRLMVTVSSIEGCLSVNIPPAPSDRLWYGFKAVPKITLTVKPVLGERTVNIVYITKWIEAKLLREFEKLVVLPNMDDLVLPLCPNYPYTTTRR